MTVLELMKKEEFSIISQVGDTSVQIKEPYCCDLLSIAMGKLPQGAAWVTVMANVNTIAVAQLADVAVVVLAEGVRLDEQAVKKAMEHGIIVLATPRSIFTTASLILKWIHE